MMTQHVLEEIVRQLRQELGEWLPQLRMEGLVVGVFFTAIKITGGCTGLARTPIEELPEAVCCPGSVGRMPRAGALRNHAVSDLVEWALDRNSL